MQKEDYYGSNKERNIQGRGQVGYDDSARGVLSYPNIKKINSDRHTAMILPNHPSNSSFFRRTSVYPQPPSYAMQDPSDGEPVRDADWDVAVPKGTIKIESEIFLINKQGLKPRLCVDCRKVNAFPTIDDPLDIFN
ncbi:hypothetical protein RF11_14000 [Thelohanellus kitauei]|uniref:Uncharacterized protein n=1 Tax=Thelohanellus kitauei TaxID=669202 RepID=A0A0C2J8M6_THEKT|nr:hypothetical protein RF11_14000 [Thelohanellus kitauei]